MKIFIPKEIEPKEKKVALVPSSVKKLVDHSFEVFVEQGAGDSSYYGDKSYKEAGATIYHNKNDIAQADIILKIKIPTTNEITSYKETSNLYCMLEPLEHKKELQLLAQKKISAFSLEFIPRSTLAQSMDILSSMATVTGYKSVLLAAQELPRFFPMLMTAAGTISPARVLILGAGVAGLSAIGTAKRLGAIVEAFDTRIEVKEQIESLGAKFIAMPEVEIEGDSDSQGYAKEMSKEFIEKEMEVIGARLEKSNICITTAQIFGKKAPLLIKKDMVEKMEEGSVIIDLAAETGGNCELTKLDEVVVHCGVKIFGPSYFSSTLPKHASQMFSKNVENLILYLIKDQKITYDFQNEILARTLVVHQGEIISQFVKDRLLS